MSCFRSYGWKPEELKLYWNAQQLEDLCSTEEAPNGEIEIDTTNEQTNEKKILPYDPSDEDAVQTLRKYPVSERNHAVKITYVHDRIEKAVFDVPEDAQIIVLNFAVNDFFLQFIEFSVSRSKYFRMNDLPVEDICDMLVSIFLSPSTVNR